MISAVIDIAWPTYSPRHTFIPAHAAPGFMKRFLFRLAKRALSV